MRGTDIFISYSRDDRARARVVAHCLEKEGFEVWWDAALHSGESFDLIIEQQLEEAKVVIVLWSPQSVKSRWVRAEAASADKYGKLSPVVIEPCTRPIIFEMLHTVDLSQWDGDRRDPVWVGFVLDLHRSIQKAIANGGRPERAPPPPPVQAKAPPAVAAPAAAPKPAPAMPTLAVADPVDDDEEQWETTQFSAFRSIEVDDPRVLSLMAGDRIEKQFPISERGTDIGRSAPADIILTDKQVSRRHCRIEPDGEDCYVVDLGSTNGTFVDGERVTDRAKLPLGAELTMGGVRLVYQLRSDCGL
jgi:hypothetical protein